MANLPTGLKPHSRHGFSDPTSASGNAVFIYPWFKLFYLIVFKLIISVTITYKQSKIKFKPNKYFTLTYTLPAAGLGLKRLGLGGVVFLFDLKE